VVVEPGAVVVSVDAPVVDVVEVVITVVDVDADVVDFTAVAGDDVVAEPEALGDDAALSLLHAVAAAARAPISSAHRSLDVRDVWDKGECMRQSSNVFESEVPPPAPILPKAHGQLTSGSGECGSVVETPFNETPG
jgi:hypothetical protein